MINCKTKNYFRSLRNVSFKTFEKEIKNLNKKGIAIPAELEQLLTDNCS